MRFNYRTQLHIGGVSLLGLGAKAVGFGEEVVSRAEGPSVEARRAEYRDPKGRERGGSWGGAGSQRPFHQLVGLGSAEIQDTLC